MRVRTEIRRTLEADGNKHWIPDWTPDPETSASPFAARILSGNTERYIDAGFSPTLFVKRLGLFAHQRVRPAIDGSLRIECPIYEQMRSFKELYRALRIQIDNTWNLIEFSMLIELCVEIFPSIYDAESGIVPLPEDDELTRGGHVVRLYGYGPQGYMFEHMWEGWRDDNSGVFSEEYLAKYLRESWVTRFKSGRMVYGDYPFAGLKFGPGEHSSDVLSPWVLVCERDDVGSYCQWIKGAGAGEPWLRLVVITKSPSGKLVIAGWLHGRLCEDHLDVEEYFVWPKYRRRGFGSILANDAIFCAQFNGAATASWFFLEDDAFTRPLLQQSSHTWMRSTSAGWLEALNWESTNTRSVRAISQPLELFEILDCLAAPGLLTANRAKAFRLNAEGALRVRPL